MKFLLQIGLIGLLPSMLTGAVFAQTEGVTTYQGCLIKAVRSGLVSNDKDKHRIEQRCRQQFPKTAPHPQLLSETLSQESLQKVELYTHRDSSGRINGSVYNGNSHKTLTSVHFLLTPVNNRDSVMAFFDSEEYELYLTVGPLQSTDFDIPASSKIQGEFRWTIISVKGF